MFYMNDLVEYIYINHVQIALYADDTAFFLAANDITTLNSKLSNAAGQFKDWCNQNKLTLNLKKCKVMLLSGHSAKKIKSLKELIDIKIENSVIEVVNE